MHVFLGFFARRHWCFGSKGVNRQLRHRYPLYVGVGYIQSAMNVSQGSGECRADFQIVRARRRLSFVKSEKVSIANGSFLDCIWNDLLLYMAGHTDRTAIGGDSQKGGKKLCAGSRHAMRIMARRAFDFIALA